MDEKKILIVDEGDIPSIDLKNISKAEDVHFSPTYRGRSHIAQLYSMMALMGSCIGSGHQHSARNGFSTPMTKPKVPIPAGAKEYRFGDFTCIAISEDRALKKYKKWLSKKS